MNTAGAELKRRGFNFEIKKTHKEFLDCLH
jgi:hypothetical protein